MKWFSVAVVAIVIATGCATTPKLSPSATAAQEATAAAQSALSRNGISPAPNVPKPGNQQRAGSNAQAASTKESTSTNEVSPNQPPAWVTNPPTDSRYFYGIDGAPDTGHPTADMAAARKAARNALATAIATTIKSDTSLHTSDNSKGDSQQSVTVLINEQVNLKLSGVELVATFHSEKWGYWYYYRLPKQALDPRPAIKRGVHELSAALKTPVTVSFGPFTYADTGLTSAFSMYLQDQVLLALRGNKNITVSAQPVTKEQSQTASNAKHADTSKKTSAAATKVSQQHKEAAGETAVLGATFFGGGQGKITVFLQLTDPVKNTVVGEGSFSVDPALLPQGVAVQPANYKIASATKQEITAVTPKTTPGFTVRLWTNRGQDATYLAGEKLTVYFSTSRDCYLRLYHIDVHGNAALILPNRYMSDDYFKAGEVYQIPSTGASYEFLLGKPYGVEFIKAIASTSPFTNEEQAFTDLGQVTRGILTRGLTVTGAGLVETAEATVSYTILGRGD